MDFSSLKKNVAELKSKAKKSYDGFVDSQAKKLESSKKNISDGAGLQAFIETSANTLSDSGKENVHRSILICAEAGTDFYKEALYYLPILHTKAWSQNTKLGLSKLPLAELQEYGLSQLPSVIVFENKQVYKIISGGENIKKIVKAGSLDINSTIESL